MDPNTALIRARQLAAAIDQADSNAPMTALASELVDVFNGLDEWLSKQGFLPDAWKR